MITQAELKEMLDYSPDTGIFIWIKPTSLRTRKGTEAGHIGNHGYRGIRIHRRMYMCHRLAWLYVYGDFPKNKIDHINMVRTDNRIENLREATQAENMFNTGLRVNNQHGYKGVSLDKRDMRWNARAKVNYKQIHLGRFATKEEAAMAYEDFAKANHGEFYHKPEAYEAIIRLADKRGLV
jgi:hypothetical protein